MKRVRRKRIAGTCEKTMLIHKVFCQSEILRFGGKLKNLKDQDDNVDLLYHNHDIRKTPAAINAKLVISGNVSFVDKNFVERRPVIIVERDKTEDTTVAGAFDKALYQDKTYPVKNVAPIITA